MPRSSPWTEQHADYLEQLVRRETLSTQEMATEMSRHFGIRVTSAHVSSLLTRMRKPSDPFFRNLPYRRQAKFAGYRHL